MASTIPSQQRVIDPFSSYDSDVVNKLTKLISRGQNCLLSDVDLQVTENDSTSVIVSVGYAIQDNVLINLTAQHTVSFYDVDHYINTNPYPENGYNYIVLNYNYVKSKPAPQASIKILKPSERSTLTSNSNLQLLKVVKIDTTNTNIVESLHDYDPENTSNKRTTVSRFGTTDAYLPNFSSSRDKSRIVYDKYSDDFYFGISDQWFNISGENSIGVNTSGLAKGDLVYIDATGTPQRAISSAAISIADGVVTEVGTLTSIPPGRIKTLGNVEGVPVESTVAGSVNVSDLLFLSLVEAGKVTNIEVYPTTQFVGRCINVVDSTSVDMLFVCKETT